MTDQQVKRFKYWEFRTMAMCIFGYALFYFVRKNLSIAMPYLNEEMGISKSDLGLFLTLHGLIYGLSKFVNGIWGDRSNARYFLVTGLVFCGICNLLFGFSSSVLALGIFWVLNGWFQGMGVPPCTRLMTHWIVPERLATKMSVWNTSPLDRRRTGHHLLRLCRQPELGRMVRRFVDALAALALVLPAPGDDRPAGRGRRLGLRPRHALVGRASRTQDRQNGRKTAVQSGGEGRIQGLPAPQGLPEPDDLDHRRGQLLRLHRALRRAGLGTDDAQGAPAHGHQPCRLDRRGIRNRRYRGYARRRLGHRPFLRRPRAPHRA